MLSRAHKLLTLCTGSGNWSMNHQTPLNECMQLQPVCVGRSLRAFCASEMQCDEGVDDGFGLFMSSILASLPTLRAPLRYLCLQRGHRTPFEGATITYAILSALACLVWTDLLRMLSACCMSGAGYAAAFSATMAKGKGEKLTAVHRLHRL